MAGNHVDADGDLPLFERYLANECSPDEAAHAEDLARRDPARAQLLRELTALKQAARTLGDEWSVDQLWSQVHAGLDGISRGTAAPSATAGASSHAPNVGVRWARWGWAVGRAAALVAITIGATLGWRALRSPAHMGTSAPAVRVYSTQPGQQAVIQLVDGTRVTLAVSSRLLVPRVFGRASREVELDGEAYFEVAHDSLLPFRVHAGHVVTRVVGTAFGIRAYASESRVEVTVAAGRVRVAHDSGATRAGERDAELGPGEVARVTRDGAIHVERGADIARHLSWRNGQLSWVDTPVPEILAELERWHGVRFTLADSTLASGVLTTTLNPGALQLTLAVLEAALDVRAVQTDSGVRLERRESIR